MDNCWIIIYWEFHHRKVTAMKLEENDKWCQFLFQSLSVECGLNTACVKIFKKSPGPSLASHFNCLSSRNIKRYIILRDVRLCEVTWRDPGFDEEGQFVPQHLRAPDVALFRGKEALRQSPAAENKITLLLHSSSLFFVSYSIQWKLRLGTRFLYLVTFPIHFSLSEQLFSVQGVFWCG